MDAKLQILGPEPCPGLNVQAMGGPLGLEALNSKPQTPNPKPQTPDPKTQNSLPGNGRAGGAGGVVHSAGKGPKRYALGTQPRVG